MNKNLFGLFCNSSLKPVVRLSILIMPLLVLFLSCGGEFSAVFDSEVTNIKASDHSLENQQSTIIKIEFKVPSYSTGLVMTVMLPKELRYIEGSSSIDARHLDPELTECPDGTSRLFYDIGWKELQNDSFATDPGISSFEQEVALEIKGISSGEAVVYASVGAETSCSESFDYEAEETFSVQ